MRRGLPHPPRRADRLSLILATLALAQVPEERPPDYEITVYGEGALREARWDAILALKRLGWEPIDKGGQTVFKPPRRWMGRAVLDREGELSFRYPIAKLKRIEANETFLPMENAPAFERDPGAFTLVDGTTGRATTTLPAGTAGLWLLPSRTILKSHYDRVREAVRPELDRIATLKRDTRVQATLDRLPGRLDAAWEMGQGLDGSTVPEDERVAHILGYWSRQPDDFEGQQVSRAMERWMRNTWTDEVTAAQAAEAAERRADHRTLEGVITPR